MRPPALRRFYKSAEVVAAEGGGFALRLDGRGARTPGKRPLVAPTRAVAELIAAEWAAQGETIEPMSMPATRLANSAIDGVADALAETRAEIAGYAAADLVCYRAEAPEALVALQAEAYDPVLAWARDSARRAFRRDRRRRPCRPAGGGARRGARGGRGLRRSFRRRGAARDDEPDRLAAAGADDGRGRAERRKPRGAPPMSTRISRSADGARTTRRSAAAPRAGAISRRRRR